MGLTQFALERIGFRRRRDEESISAAFSCVYTFEVQGISPSAGMLVDATGNVAGVEYRLALSDTLNAAARRAASDDFIENEAAWVTEHKCSPPYLLVHIGPTAVHEMTGDFLKEESTGLQTYDAFIPARRELRAMESKVMPSLLSALSCVFGTLRHAVKFRKLDRVVSGKTADGRDVFDFGFEMRGELRVGQEVPLQDLMGLFGRATQLATRMNPKIAEFYYLALGESDPLKRFLFLYFTIERQTHAVFQSINHTAHMADFAQIPERVQKTGNSLLATQPERWKSLRERFAWCAIAVWTQLTDDDVDDFVEVKKIRDLLAHGEITAPPAAAVLLIERISAKLQTAT